MNRSKLQHILEYAKQQRHIGMHCKVPPEDMVEIVEMAMLQGDAGSSPVILDGLNIRAVAALREAVRNQWLKSDEFAEKVYWKNMHDIANEIVVALLPAAPQQEVK
ncbi:TPA: hypothetical protein QHP25_001112 [Enterobacter hormaechei subsp. oharae]|nr:hypothetical protein [Enterobacter hormaechei subsp. xiangfangensis]HDT2501791.1 hypothetical protein [Enterobacter hormaechei subsp. oharae]